MFSGRRRHTSIVSGWRSDVCASNLPGGAEPARIYLSPPSVHAGLTVPAPTEPARIYLSPPSVHAGLTVPAPMKRAVLFVALVVLAWLVWDTGADPVRLARGLPWILRFLRPI